MKNRMLIELERIRKEINREVINPLVPELALADLSPLLTMVANARADYVKALLDLAQATEGEAPSIDQVHQLRDRRLIFEELVTATNALETVIQREYMDVKDGQRPKAG
ncbi:hypothetical protein SAMN05660443_0901 [Marinospirillum celere]|uniref:Uncharacterized protein n=1 Tax=Marinospirillum celere TaxID=1122252 RepID=A0A1I1EW74_9GAMM|nr:hypothetical protein [Marinospirillum celere]SFB91405.1 hypothetical protein SAMN05660443_0901 [Marinospirillum celere]